MASQEAMAGAQLMSVNQADLQKLSSIMKTRIFHTAKFLNSDNLIVRAVLRCIELYPAAKSWSEDKKASAVLTYKAPLASALADHRSYKQSQVRAAVLNWALWEETIPPQPVVLVVEENADDNDQNGGQVAQNGGQVAPNGGQVAPNGGQVARIRGNPTQGGPHYRGTRPLIPIALIYKCMTR
jgi:hypothetical protein